MIPLINLGAYVISHYQAQENYVTIAADDKMYLRLPIGLEQLQLALLGYIQFIRIDI